MRKRFWPMLLAVTALALAVRLVVCHELLQRDGAVSHPPKATDMAVYQELSDQVAAGTFHGEFYFQPFYYAVFLSGLKKMSLGSTEAQITVQALLGALTVLLAALAAALLFGRLAALAAGLALALCAPAVYHTAYALVVTLQSFWMAAIALTALLALRHRKAWLWGVCGLCTGCAILTTGNVWLLVPGLAVAAFLGGGRRRSKKININPAKPEKDAQHPQRPAGGVKPPRKSGEATWTTPGAEAWPPEAKKGIPPAAAASVAGGGDQTSGLDHWPLRVPFLFLIIYLGAMALPQLPFIWRNTQLRGALTGPSTAGGAVLSFGNTPESPPSGNFPDRGPGLALPSPTQKYWMDTDKTTPVSSRVWNFLKEEPLAYLELSFRKALLFWDHRDVPNNNDVNTGLKISPALRRLCPFGFALVFILAAPCLALFPPSKRGRAVLLYLILAYWLSISAFYILDRFRVPLLPLLAIGAGGTVAGTWRLLRTRRWNRRTRLALTLLALALFVAYAATDVYRFGFESQVMRLVRPDGVHADLGDKVTVLDNGPMIQGSWLEIPLKPGSTVVKTFVTGRTEAEFVPSLFASGSAKATFRINGKTFAWESPGPEASFKIPLLPGGKVEMQLLDCEGELFCVADYQRDYGRTLLDGAPLPAELVARLYLRQ